MARLWNLFWLNMCVECIVASIHNILWVCACFSVNVFVSVCVLCVFWFGFFLCVFLKGWQIVFSNNQWMINMKAWHISKLNQLSFYTINFFFTHVFFLFKWRRNAFTRKTTRFTKKWKKEIKEKRKHTWQKGLKIVLAGCSFFFIFIFLVWLGILLIISSHD